MSTSTKKKLEEQPNRSYKLPGGPYARDLGTTNLLILADFKRGSDDDQGYGDKR